ncbi:TIGR04222 domain-containing membrane protein [Streptomyces venezuelae]|uniref:TIGR04222 domain-containing membrane protein n=1 Tax=Streptomyces venezuelae TaxID=54571 RepID=UPI001CC2534F|nr:TIGR04222 domain-containing membrane protein [Streptomyces venezuelae]
MIVMCVLLWLAVLGSTGWAALGIRRARGAALPGPAPLDLAEAAFLTGGPRRVADTALVSLCYDGRMMIGGPGIVQVRTGARGNDPAERAVLEVFGSAASGALHPVRSAAQTHPAVRETGEGLAARGLLIAPGALSRWRTGRRSRRCSASWACPCSGSWRPSRPDRPWPRSRPCCSGWWPRWYWPCRPAAGPPRLGGRPWRPTAGPTAPVRTPGWRWR